MQTFLTFNIINETFCANNLSTLKKNRFLLDKFLSNGRTARERVRLRAQADNCFAAARSDDFLPPVVPAVLFPPLLRTDFFSPCRGFCRRRDGGQGLCVSDSSAGAVGACREGERASARESERQRGENACACVRVCPLSVCTRAYIFPSSLCMCVCVHAQTHAPWPLITAHHACASKNSKPVFPLAERRGARLERALV